MKISTKTLAGTATLAALVVVFDYTLKYSNLKIPFPWLPYLKFDFTGIPVVLSALLFGFVPGIITSVVACVAILARSGDALGSSMKGLAEFSTILGMAIGLRLFSRFRVVVSSVLGITSRVLVMVAANLLLIYGGVLLLPSAYADVSLLWALLIGMFNVLQGSLSVAGGCLVYEALRKRAPSLIRKTGFDTGSD